MAKQTDKKAKPKARPGAKGARSKEGARAPRAKPQDDRAPRDAIIDAMLALAEKRGWNEITLKDIAAEAGLPLSGLVGEFGSKLAILRGFMKRIDVQVMDNTDASLADEPARERLFDVLIARFEALSPHKQALRSIFSAIARDPDALLALNGRAVRSQMAMLAAANIETEGASGYGKAQGLALLMARVFRVWLKDDDPGMARTMAELDRRLRAGESMLERIAGARRGLRMGADALSALRKRLRQRRRGGATDAG